jgi:hypothetical protein
MVLCEILGCTPNDLIRRAESADLAIRERRSVASAGVGDLVPKKARIAPAGRRSGG